MVLSIQGVLIRVCRAVATLLVAVALCGVVNEASAQTQYDSKVVKILTDAANYGGCMALLTVTGDSQGATGCTSAWVSFDCTGAYNTKSIANQMLSAAQLALVTDTYLTVRVDNTKTFNGLYCLVTGADNNNI